MVRAVAAEGVDAVAIVCTNLAGAVLAPDLEAELGVPVIDSVAVTLWKGLDLAGCPTAHLAAHGRAFAADGRAVRERRSRNHPDPRRITQRYGTALAVDTVTLDIKGGELVALLGPRAAARPPCCGRWRAS